MITSKACYFQFIVSFTICFVCIGGSLYKFRCNSGKCTRQHSNFTSGTERYFDTLNECRLLCGEYSSLWPIPTKELRLGDQTVEIHPNSISFNYTDGSDEVRGFLNQTQEIFLDNLFKECGPRCVHSTVVPLHITIKLDSNDLSLTWATNESYVLHVASDNNKTEVTLTASNVFGARHGLETLSQLMVAKNYADGNCLLVLAEARISDSPKFAHRGFLLDTARNYISTKAILRQLDGMASIKMNVLHWHITDSQSFPLELVSYPQVTKQGAYSEDESYSQADVRNIFQYAKQRGIRVILEFDAPAHAGNGWQWAPSANLGNIAVCINEQPWRQLCIEPPCGQFNPANENLYKVLDKVYSDFAQLIPAEEILHMGGDEVFFGCWNATEEIVDYLSKQGKGRGASDFLDLWAEFQSKVLELWDRARNSQIPSPTVLWSSHLTDPSVIEKYLPKDRYIIQTWVEKNADLPKKLLKKGYRLIISTKNAWYFDHGFWGVTTYYNWRKVYNNKILNSSLILGGEACTWTEFIDEHSLDSRTWPRLAAVGERLWADPTMDATKAEGRFYRQRDRLIKRGLSPEAVTPFWCEQNEGECR
ncbi:chitooligosaccharidolytic beta-N-acetylglucosaminidase [Wyeomyia smithii]|uniref:chitooligosaccharidolytic beta-N-acetylglucosaminidase n=1 Tax=Wyeomyia smithii TaxID=174621 RepID=UPI002467ECFF|nr:chitooligosaccharidolytic beta-N-acetylglucosaminidase [Wyeomyia smithii]